MAERYRNGGCRLNDLVEGVLMSVFFGCVVLPQVSTERSLREGLIAEIIMQVLELIDNEVLDAIDEASIESFPKGYTPAWIHRPGMDRRSEAGYTSRGTLMLPRVPMASGCWQPEEGRQGVK